jgi:predicted acetyltransferase
MAPIEIRRVDVDELEKHWLPLVAYAFNATPPIETEEFREKYKEHFRNRYIVVLFDNGAPVATANLHTMTQSVREKVLPMGGVAGVATQPQARRKGYARLLVQHLFEYMHEQQLPISTLYPFRESFYGRLGYAGFTKERIVCVSPGSLSGAMRVSMEGRVEFMHLRDANQRLQEFETQLQPHWHGKGRFSTETETDRNTHAEYWVAFAWQGETLVGAMVYKLHGFAKEMHVITFLYTSMTGKYLLLNWLARHVDQVSTIWLRLRPDEYLETWLFDTDTKVHSPYFGASHPFDGPTPMGRVMDVMHLGGLKVGDGSIVVAVQDEQCHWNNGTFHLQCDNGVLYVERTDAAAACVLSIQALSALVYGVADPADFVFRAWGNPSEAAQATLRQMFPRRLPWLDAKF